MKIRSGDIEGVIDALCLADSEDKLWFGYSRSISSVAGWDLKFYDSEDHARLHKGADDILLPVAATAVTLQELMKAAGEGIGDLELNHATLLSRENEINLNITRQNLEMSLQSFDWSRVFYDPLEANVQAEALEDKIQFAKLEDLMNDLKEVHQSSTQGSAIVGDLTLKYWEGTPMESQIFENNFNMKDNLTYLQDQVKYHGFGETLHTDMQVQIAKGVGEFNLAYKTEVNKKEIEAMLHFRKADNSETYFLNKYDVRMQTEKNNETLSQTFYFNKGNGVTLKEAYNLLNGRAVHKELLNKEGHEYKAWVQLDFSKKDQHGNFERKQYHQNYGYDLKEALSYFPIKEMMNEGTAKDFMRSLEKGNVQAASIEVNGKDTKVFIEANPQFKTVNIYASNMQRLGKDAVQELMQKPEIKESKEQAKSKVEEKNQQQGLGQGDQHEKKHKGRRVNGGDDENGLIKKKREGKGKGMSIG